MALAVTYDQWHPQVEARFDEYAVSARDHQSGLIGAPSTVGRVANFPEWCR